LVYGLGLCEALEFLFVVFVFVAIFVFVVVGGGLCEPVDFTVGLADEPIYFCDVPL